MTQASASHQSMSRRWSMTTNLLSYIRVLSEGSTGQRVWTDCSRTSPTSECLCSALVPQAPTTPCLCGWSYYNVCWRTDKQVIAVRLRREHSVVTPLTAFLKAHRKAREQNTGGCRKSLTKQRGDNESTVCFLESCCSPNHGQMSCDPEAISLNCPCNLCGLQIINNWPWRNPNITVHSGVKRSPVQSKSWSFGASCSSLSTGSLLWVFL